MKVRALWVVLWWGLLVGCGPGGRVVRPAVEPARAAAPTTPGSHGSLRLDAASFGSAMAELVRGGRSTAMTPRVARSLMTGSSTRDAPLGTERHGVLLVRGASGLDALSSGYVRWCQQRHQARDCLSLLKEGSSLEVDARYTLAMALATEVVWSEARQALGELAEPERLRTCLVSAMAMYMMLWVIPEPVSKGIAAVLTAGLIASLGADVVWGLMGGWFRLVEEVDRATTFEEVRRAGERYGQIMGRNAARVFMLMATAALGHSVGSGTRGFELPGVARSGMEVMTPMGIQWVAVREIQSVAVSARGAFTFALASGVFAMATWDSENRSASASSATHHVTSRQDGEAHYRFNTGHAFNRVHKSGLDWRKTPLSSEEVERSIMDSLRAYRAGGGTLPEAIQGAVPSPYIGQTVVRGWRVEFSAVQSVDKTVYVGTYYLVP